MFVFTHALLPVFAAQAAQGISLATRRQVLFPEAKSFVAIGLAGAAPDLLSPHLSLAARYASWTHNLWFLLATIPVLYLAAGYFASPGRWRTILCLWLAILLHLATDALSNGINWLYPLREQILSIPLIPYRLWIWSDLLFLVLVPCLGLLLRHLHGRAADSIVAA